MENGEGAWRNGFARKEIGADTKGVIDGGDTCESGEGAEIVNVAGAAGQGFHCEEVVRRGCHDAEPGMIEDTASTRVVFAGDVDGGLFVEPPAGQAELVGDGLRFFEDDSVGDEHRVDVAGDALCVVGQRHRGTSDDEEVGGDSASEQRFAKGGESTFEPGAVEKDACGVVHAAVRSLAER
ncbi:hypothetical protein [Sphaerisporangium rhizosphaerae]|uniref:Uncharacterized protein n=1 Tax=Sphaerisporangium rhizosphaerae TaxID=2269375 RepID=A0ABW2PDQ3_9ACTN